LTPEGCPDPYNFDPFGPQPPVIIPIQRILDIFEISPTINWPPTWGGPAFIPPRQGGSPGVGYWFDLPWPPWETPYYPPLPGTRP
jgi:hypothetical protein